MIFIRKSIIAGWIFVLCMLSASGPVTCEEPAWEKKTTAALIVGTTATFTAGYALFSSAKKSVRHSFCQKWQWYKNQEKKYKNSKWWQPVINTSKVIACFTIGISVALTTYVGLKTIKNYQQQNEFEQFRRVITKNPIALNAEKTSLIASERTLRNRIAELQQQESTPENQESIESCQIRMQKFQQKREQCQQQIKQYKTRIIERFEPLNNPKIQKWIQNGMNGISLVN